MEGDDSILVFLKSFTLTSLFLFELPNKLVMQCNLIRSGGGLVALTTQALVCQVPELGRAAATLQLSGFLRVCVSKHCVGHSVLLLATLQASVHT